MTSKYAGQTKAVVAVCCSYITGHSAAIAAMSFAATTWFPSITSGQLTTEKISFAHESERVLHHKRDRYSMELKMNCSDEFAVGRFDIQCRH